MDGDTSELTKVVEQVVEQMWDRYLIIKEVTAIPIGTESIPPSEFRRRFKNDLDFRRDSFSSMGINEVLRLLNNQKQKPSEEQVARNMGGM